MSIDTTEDDAEIARILSEQYDWESNLFCSDGPNISNSSSPILSKNPKIDEDYEMAFILQIEEIVLSENGINEKTMKTTDVQLEKTHADMTKALQQTEQTDFMARMFGMFTAIQTRYANCQTKNQVLIDQIQKISIELYPALISFTTKGKLGASKIAVSTLALGLITNVLQGNIEMNDAKQIMTNMLQIWNESNAWYECLEQLVYILVAVTIPSFAQGAMGKIMGQISSTT